MKQRSLEIFIDGASRGNPGHAGIGILVLENKEPISQKGFYIGNNLTNNVAEYMALYAALHIAKKLTGTKAECNKTELKIKSDSQLLVQQMVGNYKVKNPTLSYIKSKVDVTLKCFKKVLFTHVYREKNTKADALANKGIDEKVTLPKYLEIKF